MGAKLEAHLIQQGTDEWRTYRAGRLGASSIGDMLAKTQKGWGASRANLAARLVAERLTGKPQDTFTNAAMQHGTETEPLARKMYEFMFDVTVEQVGYFDHPSIPMAGCSPDGLVGSDGLFEAKCPNTATHIATLLGGGFDKKYHLQCQWQMSVTGRKWADLVSFDPRLPEEMQIYRERVHRDDAMIAELEREARTFLAEVDQTISKLTAKYRHPIAAE